MCVSQIQEDGWDYLCMAVPPRAALSWTRQVLRERGRGRPHSLGCHRGLNCDEVPDPELGAEERGVDIAEGWTSCL